MNVKRVAGAIGAELQAINLGTASMPSWPRRCANCLMSTRCSFARSVDRACRSKGTGRDIWPFADASRLSHGGGISLRS